MSLDATAPEGRQGASRAATPAQVSQTIGSALRPRLESRPWRDALRTRLLVGDMAAVGVAMLIAGWLLRQHLLLPEPTSMWLWMLAIGCSWVLTLSATGCRSIRLLGSGSEEYLRILRASVGLFGVIALIGYAVQATGLRWLLLIALPLGTALLLTHRLIARRILTRRRERDRAYSAKVALVGDQDVVRHIDGVLRAEPAAGYVPQIAVVPCPEGDETPAPTLPLPTETTGNAAADVVEVLDRHPEIDAIAVSGARMRPTEMRRLGWLLHDRGVSMIMAEALTDVAGTRIETEPVGGTSLVHVAAPSLSGGKALAKRILDVVGAGTALLLLAPLLALIAIAVKLDSPGPVLFHQERVGRRGEPIRMHKFRSMVTDAEERLAQLEREEEDGPGNDVLFKLKDDPRVTRVGGFLRAYSLDELPQLWNVLVGEMSLVGPRPPLPCEVEQYEPDAHRRLEAPPGITGLWQVSGRSDLSWDESVRLDLYYVENWSLATDILILLRTVKVVLTRSGAY